MKRTPHSSADLCGAGWFAAVVEIIPRDVLLALSLALLVLLDHNVFASDWPTFQHDSARSGATLAEPPGDPVQFWQFKSLARPIPAWDEPAVWDGWSKTHNLTNRQVYDKALHVAAVGDAVYFGSSVDDKIYCVDADTGAVRWEFFTEAPVRLAPTVHQGRVYVGSDDGFVYCLDAATGNLAWRHQAGLTDRRMPGNGRMVSPWAIRTGVVIEGNRAYFGAGVIPSESVFVVALDAATGQQVWKTEMNDLPAQGYLLASSTRVYVVTGRDRPLIFDAATGKRLTQVKAGTGGTYALLTGDTLLYGPSKTGEVSMIGGQQDVLASFNGNHMIVARPFSYLHSGKDLSALDRESYVEIYGKRTQVADQRKTLEKQLKELTEKQGDAQEIAKVDAEVKQLDEQIKALSDQMAACVKWVTPCDCPLSLILAGQTLIAGGEGKVVAFDANSGAVRWERFVPGKAYGLAVAHDRLYVSTDEGAIHCFAQRPENTNVAFAEMNNDLYGAQGLVRMQDYVGPFVGTREPPIEIHGPFAEFIAPQTIRIRWESLSPMTSELEFGVQVDTMRKFSDDSAKTQHEFIVENVQRDIVHRYRIAGALPDGRRIETDLYQFDSHFDYLPLIAPDRPSPYPDDELSARYEAAAKAMIDAAGGQRGYALVVGAVDGRLAFELAKNSQLQVIVVEQDAQRVAQVRKSLDQAGLYGARVSVLQGPLETLPFGPFLFNLITSERTLGDASLPTSYEQLVYCLRPAGGVICLASPATDSVSKELLNERHEDNAQLPENSKWEEVVNDDVRLLTLRREKLDGTGEWTHMYGQADNSSCSQDDRVQGALTVQWWGRPGARPMPDRGNRNPPPVSANGRLYVQGNRTLFGLDAYNGTILWSKQIPTMRRANMPRDGSNMVATDDQLFVSIGGHCVVFDGQTGERQQNHAVPRQLEQQGYNWGFIARAGEELIGSGVKHGSQYSGDKGEWYEGFGERDIARVTSDFLFSAPWYSGQPQWMYQNGVLLNSTITIADDLIFFIESRNPAAKQNESGRMLVEVLQDQVLVALNRLTGEVVWEKPYDFSQCEYVTYMTHGNGTLIVSGTDKDSMFHTYAFDAASGEELWKQDTADKKGHHTGQLAHPTIVGDRVFFNKHTFALRTGEILDVENFDWHGCGVMSASKHSIFSRYEYHGMYDLATKQRTEFLGLRSGCWLSLIPSGGLLLAPETSAGCSCGHSLQTSLAYVPKAEYESGGIGARTTIAP
jgi:outer membrane protein assembly factor BamB